MAFRHGGALSRSMRSAFHSSPSLNPIRASGGRSSSSAATSASSSSIARASPSPRRNPSGNDSASVRPRSASSSSPLSRLPAELGGVISMLPLTAATLTSPFCLSCRSCSALSQGDIGVGDGGGLNFQASAILEVMLVAQDAYYSFYLEGNRLKSNVHPH